MIGISVAESLRSFFDLQLRFAEKLASKSSFDLEHALSYYTHLHRRFGYGNVARQTPDAEFVSFASQLAAIPEHAERLDAIVAAFAHRPASAAPPDTSEFGCFRCESPDERGHVRIHFSNRDTTGDTSPLHDSKLERRRAELRALIGFIAQTYPQTKAIDGGSWLYNTQRYRRLFPVEFADSRRAPTGPRWIHGGSTWGQFLDFRGAVNPARREVFLSRLDSASFDPQCPWSVFPLQALKTSAALACFQREYGG